LEPAAPAVTIALPSSPQVMTVDVNGQPFRVTVSYGDTSTTSATTPAESATPPAQTAAAGAGNEVLSPLEGKFFLIKNTSDTPLKVGDVVKEGQLLCYIEAMKTYNAVRSEFSGTITAITLNNGDSVVEDDVIMTIQ
jgi:pyruvate carboxylase subunit B